MAGSLNKVILAGNVGQDPQINTTKSGSTVAALNLATNRSYKDRDGNRQSETQWHRVVVWQSGDKGLVTSVIEPYVQKGTAIIVTGELRHRSYEKNGERKYISEVVVSGPQAEFILNGSKVEARHGADTEALTPGDIEDFENFAC
jgi:single-strand DNA-binding protein